MHTLYPFFVDTNIRFVEHDERITVLENEVVDWSDNITALEEGVLEVQERVDVLEEVVTGTLGVQTSSAFYCWYDLTYLHA